MSGGPVTIAACTHDDAVPVESSGKIVAWLCPDCDGQLGADWKPFRQRAADLSADHDRRHHGHPLIMVLGCPKCGQEEMARW